MKENSKKKIRSIFIAFFAAMLLLTMISRLIDSIIIPKVQVQTYAPGNLSYHMTGEGIVEAANQVYLDIPQGIKVDQVLKAGEKVKEGQGVIFLRLSDLEEKKKDIEREMRKQELSLEKEKIGQKAEAKISQMEEIAGDLALAEQNLQGLQVTLEKEQEKYAKEAEALKKKYKNEQDFEKQRRSNTKEEISQLNETLDDESKKSYAPAELVYDEAMARIEEEYEESLKLLEEERGNAIQEINSKQDAFHQLVYQARLAVKKDEYVKQNEQTAALVSQKTQEILKLELETQKEKLEHLEELILAGGEVRCPWDGVITKMEVVPGTATSENEIVEVGRGMYVLEGALKKEQASMLELGDKIQITMPLETRAVKGTITNIQMIDSSAEFTAELEEGEYQIGSSATYEIQKSMEMKYPCLIPLEAVREDGEGKFCLIAEKKKTILGEELIAERINLELVNKDDTKAAVNSVFADQDLIITGSNKSIAEGDRVRIENE